MFHFSDGYVTNGLDLIIFLYFKIIKKYVLAYVSIPKFMFVSKMKTLLTLIIE